MKRSRLGYIPWNWNRTRFKSATIAQPALAGCSRSEIVMLLESEQIGHKARAVTRQLELVERN